MLKNIHISSCDDDRDDDADPEEVEDLMNDDDDEDDDEVQKPVTLGFVEKPKNKWFLFVNSSLAKLAWLDPDKLPSAASKSLWPQHEIVNEDEAEYDVNVSADLENTDCLVSRNQMDDSINSLIESFQGDSDRRSWGNFQERIARAPEQVLRYCRSVCSMPLWPISSGQPSTADIPNCSYCGKPRCFEFQVLPRLLYSFGVKNDAYSLDWATIAVYSCEASCDGAASYEEEFAWVQVSSPSQVVP